MQGCQSCGGVPVVLKTKHIETDGTAVKLILQKNMYHVINKKN